MKNILLLLSYLLIINSYTYSQWLQTNGIPAAPVNCMTVSGNNLYAGITFASTNGIFLSSNNGMDWNGIGLPNRTVNGIAISNEKVFAGTDSGVYVTTNNGTNWTAVSYGLSFKNIKALAFCGTDLYAGSTGIWKSTNFGILWFQTSLTNFPIKTILISGTTIFVGTNNNSIYLSSNNGTTWNNMNLPNQNISSLIITGSDIFAGTLNGVFLTSNYGINWKPVNNGLTYLFINGLVADGNNIFAGGGSVYESTNSGTNWIEKNEGITQPFAVNCFLVSGGYIFVGTTHIGIWRRPLSEFIGIKKISSEIPSGFSLSQNYPNPFNPSTNIKFNIPPFEGGLGGIIGLKVYNILGKEIALLVNEKLQPGVYEIPFSINQFPYFPSSSGIYFYKLEIINNNSKLIFSDTKKMLMIK